MERSVQETRVDRPRDVGIGIAAPLTHEDFHAQLAEASHYEFARRQPFVWRSSSEGWDFYHENTVRHVRRIARVVAALDATVVERCTAADVRNLVCSFPIVVLVAHWQTGHIHEDDLIDIAAFRQSLVGASEGTLFALRSALSEKAHAELVGLANSPVQPSSTLLTSINAALETMTFAAAASSAYKAFRLYANRIALQRALGPGILHRGTGIELHDTLLSAHEFARMLPRERPGVLDLTVCLSTVVGDVARSHGIDWRILMNRQETTALLRLLIVEQVIELLAQRPGNYIQRNREIRAGLAQGARP